VPRCCECVRRARIARRAIGAKGAPASVKIHANSTLLMTGDSITDGGRVRPVAEAVGGDLGNGYVALVNAVLGATCLERRIRIGNTGISGNTVRDLAARWQSDVLDLKPDWLSIMIGINDVWRQFDAPLQTELHVPLDEYASILEQLVRATRPRLEGLVLMTPYFIEPNRADPMRAMMDRYGEVVRQLAGQYQAILVDTQAAFDCVLTKLHPMALASDRVHPNLAGHMVLARAFLNALEYTW
jgi:lysophospholipase L1-like esterase